MPNNPASPIEQTPLQLKPAVHPTYARLLCAHLHQEGYDNETVLAGTRLKWPQLTSEHRYLSFAQLSRLVDRAIALTGRPWLGIEISDMTALSIHGPLGYAALSAPDIRSVLDVLTRFAGVRSALSGVEVVEHPQSCEMRMIEHMPLGTVREFVLASSLATLIELMDTLLAGFKPDLIKWPQPRPPHAAEYERRLPAPMEFNTPRLAVTMPLSVLDTPVLTADPSTYRSALRDCEAQLRRNTAGGALSQRLYEYLLTSEGAYPGLDTAADAFAMSRRTLIRRLKDEHTSYQALLDEVRQELTGWHLLETDMPIAQIAEIAGYRDTSNFSRTVRRWFGMTPQQMRASGDH